MFEQGLKPREDHPGQLKLTQLLLEAEYINLALALFFGGKKGQGFGDTARLIDTVLICTP